MAAKQAMQGRPYSDPKWPGGPQKIPGKVWCAYYDFGGEGVAYHDTTAKNQGSGVLNPPDGSYLNEFRMDEGVDISYTKPGGIDDGPFSLVQPEMGMLYVGWTEPGEWINYTVEVPEAGDYIVDVLYTSNRGGAIALALDGCDLAGPIRLQSTFCADDDLPWRQWHHWNIARGAARVRLENGIHMLTLSTVEDGQMNYAYLAFSRVEE